MLVYFPWIFTKNIGLIIIDNAPNWTKIWRRHRLIGRIVRSVRPPTWRLRTFVPYGIVTRESTLKRQQLEITNAWLDVVWLWGQKHIAYYVSGEDNFLIRWTRFMAVGHAQRTPRHSAFESRKIGYVIKWRDRQSPEMHLRVGNKSKCPLAAYST